MSKNIRQKITRAIRKTFRLSASKSKIIPCDVIKKPNGYKEFLYSSQQKSIRNDYIDLSECYSLPLSYSKDSGILSTSSINKNCYQLESTRIFSDDSSSLSIYSNLSSIPYFNVMPISFQCCHCHCHHYVNSDILLNQIDNYLYTQKQNHQRLMKNKIYPFIF